MFPPWLALPVSLDHRQLALAGGLHLSLGLLVQWSNQELRRKAMGDLALG